MSNWHIWAFAIASGFVAAGFLSALHRCVTGSPAGFRFAADSPVHVIWGFFICMFAGPHIVASGALRRWSAGGLSVSTLLLAALIAIVWSLFAGVLVAQLWWWAGMIIV